MAQVKTGGGPFADEYTDDQMFVDNQLNLLVEELKKNDLKCTKSPRIKNENSIVHIYMKLSIHQHLEKSSELCEDDNQYLACVNSKAASEHVQQILMTPKSLQYIGQQYKIDTEVARKMLKFFTKPERKKTKETKQQK